MESNHDNGIPAVDQIANGSNLQMYKAVIPYLPRTLQKNCILMIKMMEMNNLLSYYNSPMSACSAPPEIFCLKSGNMGMIRKINKSIRC